MPPPRQSLPRPISGAGRNSLPLNCPEIGVSCSGKPSPRCVPGMQPVPIPTPQGCTHRHKPLILVQTLLVGGDEEAPVLDPARVQARLLLQLVAHHSACMCQEFHFHVARPKLPQEAWWRTLLVHAWCGTIPQHLVQTWAQAIFS